MKFIQLTKQLAAVAVVASLFTACDKVKTVDPIGDAGQTIVKLVDGGAPGSKAYAIDFVPVPIVLTMADLRRDIPNNAELNKTMKVTIKDDTAALRAFNPALVYLPANFYTISTTTPKTGGKGGVFNITLNPGEHAKPIDFTITNPTLLDPSTKYGMAFTITTADAGGKISSAKTIVVSIGAKNNWDGQYAVTGPMVDITNPAFVQWNNPAFPGFPAANGGAWELHLLTIGANTCLMFDNTIWGSPFHPMLNNGGNSGWGSYCLVIDFNPANGQIADIHNYYGEVAQGGSGAPLYSAGNTRRATLDPSGVNAVQGNKDILIKYFMNMPSVIAAPPHIRVYFNETWKYLGPR